MNITNGEYIPPSDYYEEEDTLEEVERLEGKQTWDRLDENFDPYMVKKRQPRESLKFTKRVFKKLENDSMRTAFMTLLTVTFGTGYLTFPKAVSWFGWIPSVITVTLTCLSHIYSYYLISHVQALDPKSDSYISMIGNVLGKKMKIITFVIVACYSIGTLTTLSIAASNFFYDVFGQVIANYLNIQNTDKFKTILNLCQFFIFGFITWVAALADKMAKLKNLSFITFFAIFLLIIVTCFQCPQYRHHAKPVIIAYGTDFKQYFKNLGIFIFMFCNTLSYHQTYTSLKSPTIQRMNKISIFTFTFSWISSLIFGTVAYLSLGQGLQKIDLFPQRPRLPGSTDIMMSITKIILSASLTITFVNNVLPLKDNIFALMKKHETSSNNILVTASIIILCIFLSWVYPNVADWSSAIGSASGILIAFTLPSYCFYVGYRKVKEYKLKVKLAACFGIVATLLGIASSAYVALYVTKYYKM